MQRLLRDETIEVTIDLETIIVEIEERGYKNITKIVFAFKSK